MAIFMRYLFLSLLLSTATYAIAVDKAAVNFYSNVPSKTG